MATAEPMIVSQPAVASSHVGSTAGRGVLGPRSVGWCHRDGRVPVDRLARHRRRPDIEPPRHRPGRGDRHGARGGRGQAGPGARGEEVRARAPATAGCRRRPWAADHPRRRPRRPPRCLAAPAAAFEPRREPATDASRKPQDGQDSRPRGTAAVQAGQTVDRVAMSSLASRSRPTGGRRVTGCQTPPGPTSHPDGPVRIPRTSSVRRRASTRRPATRRPSRRGRARPATGRRRRRP